MFGLFGGSKKKKEEPKPQPQQPIPNKEMKREKAMHDVNSQIDKMDDAIDKYEEKIEKINEQVRTLIQQKKKRQALQKMSEAKEYSKHVTRMENQRSAMSKLKIQLESAATNEDAVQAMTGATDILKEQDKINEQLEDQMLDLQEIEANRERVDDLWAQMGNTQNDELEDEYAQLEAQMQSEALNDVPLVKTDPSLQQQQQQQQQQINKPQSQQVQQPQQQNMENALDAMLN